MDTDGRQLRLSYLAGVFDAAGTFSIQVQERNNKINFSPKMALNSGPVDAFVQWFGGSVYETKTGSRRWTLSNRKELIQAASALYPYLDIKKDKCMRFLSALTLFPTSKWGVKLNKGESAWTDENIMTVAQIALTLNDTSESKTKQKLQTLQDIGKLYASVDALIGVQA